MENEIESLRQQLHEAWQTALSIAETFQEMGEHLTSELPFDHPERQIFDSYLPELRAAIDKLRDRVQKSASSPR